MVLNVVGSSPTRHPKEKTMQSVACRNVKDIAVFDKLWRFHLAVRIPASHAGYTSSSLVGATILERWVSG